MKKIHYLISAALLAMCCSSCYTSQMKGSPAAVAAGSSIGGVVGSIVGDRAGGYNGSQFGALVGTVAGAVIGNAVTTPRTEKVTNYHGQVASEPYYAPSALRICNIRFIDDNRNRVIDASEGSKLIFEIVNEGTVPAYNITPIVEEISEMKHLTISPSALISYMAAGDRIRYTANIAGGKRLKNGEAVFRVYATESNGAVSETHEFAIPTAKRKK